MVLFSSSFLHLLPGFPTDPSCARVCFVREQFTAMHYRIAGAFHQTLPFRVSLTQEGSPGTSGAGGSGRADLLVRLDCDVPTKVTAATITVRVPLPKYVSGCAYELGAPGQTVEYKKDARVAVWRLTKAAGGLSYYCRLKVMGASADELHALSREVGPISLEFEVPQYVCSGLGIRHLRVVERGADYVPYRWVRYVTHRCVRRVGLCVGKLTAPFGS